MTRDAYTDEDIAFFKHEVDHALAGAEKTIDDALNCEPLWAAFWGALTDDKLRTLQDTMQTSLGKEVFWQLFDFASAVYLTLSLNGPRQK